MNDALKGLLFIIITLGVLSGVLVGGVIAVRDEYSWAFGAIVGGWLGLVFACSVAAVLGWIIAFYREVVDD